MITAAENTNGKTSTSSTSNRERDKLIMAISIPITIILIIACALFIIFLRRKGKTAEEPKIDANIYYGHEEEDSDEHDNTIVDTNDYYGT